MAEELERKKGKRTFSPEEHAAARADFARRHPHPAKSLHHGPYPDVKSYPRQQLPPGLTKPQPKAHAQTPEAKAAVEAIKRYAQRRDRVSLPLHTGPLPQLWRQVELDDLPTAAQRFAKAAIDAGREVAYRMAGDRAAQVGVRARHRNALEIRATWRRPGVTWSAAGALHSGEPVGMLEAKALLSE